MSEKSKALPRRLRWRTLFKLAILAIFIATLIPVLHLAIPALAYRDDLLALLNTSEDCRAPCFMGITPGVTTYDEAIEILENHNWVETVILETPGRNEYYAIIKWEWTDNAPEILRATDLSSSVYSAYRDNIIYHTDSADGYIRWENSSQPPDLHPSFVDFTSLTISEMIIFSDIPYITYVGLLGFPDFESTTSVGLVYSEQGINIGMPCGNGFIEAFTQDTYNVRFTDIDSQGLMPVSRWMYNGCGYLFYMF